MPKFNMYIDSNWELVSKDIHILPGQHRLFKIENKNETYLWVKDWLSETKLPYKLLPLPEGTYHILQIKKVEKGRFEMQDSILNYFIIGEYASLKVLRTIPGFLHLGNDNDQFSFLAGSNLTDLSFPSALNLKIDELDLNNNIPVFSPNPLQVQSHLLYQNPLLKVFGFEQKQRVNPVRLIPENTHSNLEFEFQGECWKVKAFPFQETRMPELIDVVVTFENDQITIKQDRIFLIRSRYEQDTLDYFLFKGLHESGEKTYLLFEDEFGHPISVTWPEFIPHENQEKFVPDHSYQLLVKSINEVGLLTLFINQEDFMGRPKFDVEDVVSSIGQGSFWEKYASDLEREFAENQFYKNPAYKNPFELIEKKENHWILSLGNFVDLHIENLLFINEFDQAEEFLIFLTALEGWIVETSDFLETFHPSVRANIIKKANEQIEKSQDRLEGIRIGRFGNGQLLVWIAEILNTQLPLTGAMKALWLFGCLRPSDLDDCQRYIDLATEVLRHLQLDPYLTFQLTKWTEKHLAAYHGEINTSGKNQFWDPQNAENTKNILSTSIQLLALQIHADISKELSNDKLSRICRICRYFALLQLDRADGLKWINHSTRVIIQEIDLNIPLDKIKTFPHQADWLETQLQQGANHLSPKKQIIYQNSGVILRDALSWQITSPAWIKQVLYNPNTDMVVIGEYFGGSLQIAAPTNSAIDFESKQTSDGMIKNWRNFINGATLPIEEPSSLVGTRVIVEYYAHFKKSPNLGFVKPLDSTFFPTFSIHLSGTTKCQLDNLEGIFEPGDRFEAEISGFSKGKPSLSIKDLAFEKMVQLASTITHTSFVITSLTTNCAFGFTEEGFFANYFWGDLEGEPPLLEVGQAYEFKLNSTQINTIGVLQGMLGKKLEPFDPKLAFRSFLEKHYLFPKKLNIPNPKLRDLNRPIREIIWNVETLLFFPTLTDTAKMSYLLMAKQLCATMKIAKSFYFDELVNFYKLLVEIRTQGILTAIQSIKPIEEQTLNRFPKLGKLVTTYQILDFFAKTNTINELIDYRSTLSEVEKPLMETLLAIRILEADHQIAPKSLGKILAAKIAQFATQSQTLTSEDDFEPDIEHTPKQPNLGKEDQFTEFKSSIVFLAGKNEPDPETQGGVILKTISGFLNATGGTLYLGVNDQGMIKGLKADYAYLGSDINADAYERYIRKLIVGGFNKDISSLIEIELLKFQNLEYAKIIIPAYEKPVPIKNRFFQRQGNETRELEGNDLILFFERKYKTSSHN